MKVITLVPVKNESWILSDSLRNFCSFSDHVIVADQNSTDDTVTTCSRFNKVTLIKNPYQAHTNQIRWLLLDEARKIEGNNIIIYLDADELLSPTCVNTIKEIAKKSIEVTGFSADWIQLLNSYKTHRVDGVWKNNYKEFAFLDDRIIDYDRTKITNDHSNRIPEIENIIHVSPPILHLQYLAKQRCDIKQAFYMCTELLQGRLPQKINYRYAVAMFSKKTKVEKTPDAWHENIHLPNENIFTLQDTIKLNQVLELFKEKGVLTFEPLNIWYIPELHKEFVKTVGKEPKIKTYPKVLILLNNIKNSIKSGILSKN